MIQRLILIPLVILILLAACAPAFEEPAAETEAPTTTPPLKEITAERPAATPTEAAAADDAGANTEVESGSTGPAEVDLSQLTAEPSAEEDPVVMPQPGVPDPGAAAAHQAAQDLAARTAVDVMDIRVATIEESEWPDGALGCPAPGKNYRSAVTPGFRITLESSGTRYVYHTDLHNNYVLCGDDGQPVTP